MQLCLDCSVEITEINRYYSYRRCRKCQYARRYKMDKENHTSDEINSSARAYKKKRQDRWVCVQCRENLMEHSASYCRKHYILKQIYQHKLKITHQEFEAILEKNNYKCPYTWLDLVLSKNMSIDHIIPKGKWGSNDMSNIAICHVDINRMKLDHTHDYLYDMCKKYIERYDATNGFENLL